jgi:hypothetical protein
MVGTIARQLFAMRAEFTPMNVEGQSIFPGQNVEQTANLLHILG